MALPLDGLMVVSLEQAVAAPTCSCRLADAGARVIKIERPEGDFARYYDRLVDGACSYFVWLNRGKESVVVDLLRDADKALFEALIKRADVFIQNLKPGAIDKLGFSVARLAREYPRLIICSISGYGETGPMARRKAYDLLIQAEAGLAHVTGGPEAPARVGVSVVDVATGLNAYQAILEALISRQRSGTGAVIAVSMFDCVAELMTVPLLQYEGGQPPTRVGLAHPSIAPYGVFRTRDGIDILVAIQNDREWRLFAANVLGDAALAADPDFATNIARVARRGQTDRRVGAVFATLNLEALSQRLLEADIAFARVTDMAALAQHPHLRRITIGSAIGEICIPAPGAVRSGETRHYGSVPALGEHTEQVRAEMMGAGKATPQAGES
jgi:formyl-CoA transferase